MPVPFDQIFLLFTPVQAILEAIQPQFLQRDLQDSAVREEIIQLANTALTAQYPETQLIPEDVRKSLIRGVVLGVVIDHALLSGQPGA